VDNPYDHNIESWRKLARNYHETFQDIRIYDTSYETFASQIESDSPAILEVGCGPATVTRWLKQRFPSSEILATDVAPEMIEEAKKHVQDVDFEVLDAREIRKINRKFDAVLAGFIIPYLTKEDLNTFVSSVADRLNESGIFYLSCIEKDYSESSTAVSSSGLEMTVHYYLEKDILSLFTKYHLHILDTIRVDYPMSSGESDTHLILIAKKSPHK
jgi:ubiquinone/menaquinone biosynthesis C-methylase UbiE